MNAKTIIYLLAGISFLFSETLIAQDTLSTIIPKKYDKIVSVSLGGPLIIYSLNHAWVVQQKPKSNLLVQWNLGYLWDKEYYSWNPNYKEHYFAGGFSINKVFGRKSNHFNLGIGHTFMFHIGKEGNFDPEIARPFEKKYYNQGYLFGDIGYTYWNQNRRFYFKFSLNPRYYYQHKNADGEKDLVSDKLYPWVELSFGYSYKKGLKIHFFERNNSANTVKSSLSIGIENTSGYSQMIIQSFGEGKGFTTSNSLILTYSPSRVFFKIKTGNTLFGYKEVTNPIGKESIIFNNIPSFWNLGFGVGYELIHIKGWKFCPEVGAGTYLLNKVKYYLWQEYPGIDLSESIDYTTYNYYSCTKYLSTALYLKRSISSNFEFNAGLQYKTSDFIKIKEYTVLVAINYKLK